MDHKLSFSFHIQIEYMNQNVCLGNEKISVIGIFKYQKFEFRFDLNWKIYIRRYRFKEFINHNTSTKLLLGCKLKGKCDQSQVGMTWN